LTNEFGALLRRLRQRARLTQEELAERAGVGVRTVRGLETGQRANPRITTVQDLARALELAPADREQLLRTALPATAGEPGTPDEPPTGKPAVGPPAARPPVPEALADVADQLAQAVAARWRHEEEQQRVQDPSPLLVRWGLAPDKLLDHWANICRTPAGETPEPLDLAGRLDDIRTVYRRIPSQRMVVLGRAGSGKTILTLRFVLDHLASRARGGPVPVVFSVGSWDPTAITLRNWLIGQLTRDHPGLAAAGPGTANLATALVEAGLVLPVLDGFDEIADRLRRPALEALNATTLPLLLTSRPGEYAAAVAETDVLTAAAAVELTDLTLDDLAGYLPRTARRAGGADPDATGWDPVLAELRDHPDSRASANLTAVLATPLMVALARTIYSDTPDHDPATLLDTDRFGSAGALEDHLLANFIPTVYRRQDHVPGRRARRVDPDRAEHWLGYLAHHLTRLGTPDLAWWQMGRGLSRPTRTLVTALATGLALGLIDAVVGTLITPVPLQFVDGVTVGLLAGIMFGLAHWLVVASRDTEVPPSAVRVRFRGVRRGTWSKAVARLTVGSLGGFVFGYAYGMVAGIANWFVWHDGLATTLKHGIDDGLIYGLVFGMAAGLTAGLLSLLETPLDIRSAVNPPDLLTANRRTVGAQFLVAAPLFGLLVGIGAYLVLSGLEGVLGPLIWSVAMTVRMGVLSGLAGAVGYALTLTAWGQWAVFSRLWLPLTGRLPWAVIPFLNDAYQRGVLRQSGAVYQFRHARLQQHLTRTHRAGRGRH
jgi:transcriptional regulator with XRE-family HTH domain